MTEIPLKTVVHITKDNIHIYIFFARQNKENTGDAFFNRGKIHNNVNIGYNKLTLKTLWENWVWGEMYCCYMLTHITWQSLSYHFNHKISLTQGLYALVEWEVGRGCLCFDSMTSSYCANRFRTDFWIQNSRLFPKQQIPKMYTMVVINGIETQNQRALLEHSPTKGNHVLPFVRHCQNLVISDNCNTINFAPCCSTLAGFTKHYIFSKFMTCVITVCQCCKTDDWKTETLKK